MISKLSIFLSLIIGAVCQAQELDKNVIKQLKQRSLETNTYSVIIQQNGKTVYQYPANVIRGIFLVIVPRLNLVAVRLADANGFNYETDSFKAFAPNF